MNIEWIKWISYIDAIIALIASAFAGTSTKNKGKKRKEQILRYVVMAFGIIGFFVLRFVFIEEPIAGASFKTFLLIFFSCLLFFAGLTA